MNYNLPPSRLLRYIGSLSCGHLSTDGGSYGSSVRAFVKGWYNIEISLHVAEIKDTEFSQFFSGQLATYNWMEPSFSETVLYTSWYQIARLTMAAEKCHYFHALFVSFWRQICLLLESGCWTRQILTLIQGNNSTAGPVWFTERAGGTVLASAPSYLPCLSPHSFLKGFFFYDHLAGWLRAWPSLHRESRA